MEEIKRDLQDIKQDVKELVKTAIIHNELLREHERRSLALEKSIDIQANRLRPIEIHVSWVNKILKFIGAVSIVVLAQYIIRQLLIG